MSGSKDVFGKNTKGLGGLVTGNAGKLPGLVPPVLREVSKLAAGVASVSTSGSATGNPRNKCALQPGHSLMDWIRLGASGKDLSGVGPQAGRLSVTLAELSSHNKRTDAWLAIRGRVYNVTEYFSYHPGGPEELMKGVGKDATALFDGVHPWVNYEQILQKCYVGRLVNLDPSINQQTLFFGNSDPSKPENEPKLVRIIENMETTEKPENSSQVPKKSSLKEKMILPRFDWIQKLTDLTVFFYTSPFSNAIVEIDPPNEENEILIILSYDGYSYINEIVFFEKIQFPGTIKVTYETGKIEINFKKHEGAIWDNYGFLRQSSKAQNLEGLTHEYVMVEKRMLNHDLFLMKLERVDNARMVAPVGCHVRMIAHVEELDISRCYSPIPESMFTQLTSSSSTSTDSLCVMIKRYASGIVSSFVTDKPIGAIVDITYPYLAGFELKETQDREVFLILVAGTGVTSILSVIAYLLERRIRKCQRIMMLNFNKTVKDIPFREQFFVLAQNDSRFMQRNILSQERPCDCKGLLMGKVNQQIVEDGIKDLLADTVYTQKDIFIFVCGPQLFNDATTEIFEAMNIPEEQFHFFW